jgi:uncharacterized repeat protein (TIGR01451 family)
MGAYEAAQADLALAKHGNLNQVPIGAPLTYTIAVTNHGASPATGVVLTDTLPGGVILSTVASTQGSCAGTAAVICNLGSLPSSSNITVTVAVTPTATGLITNTATVTANEIDPVSSNNTASETTAVFHPLYLPLITRGP